LPAAKWNYNCPEGRYPEALDIYQRGLAFSESIHDLFGIAASLGHIGEIYADQGDYQKARSYYYRYLEIKQLHG
jgi:tetratricopeptide (TPR) repeat protein